MSSYLRDFSGCYPTMLGVECDIATSVDELFLDQYGRESAWYAEHSLHRRLRNPLVRHFYRPRESQLFLRQLPRSAGYRNHEQYRERGTRHLSGQQQLRRHDLYHRPLRDKRQLQWESRWNGRRERDMPNAVWTMIQARSRFGTREFQPIGHLSHYVLGRYSAIVQLSKLDGRYKRQWNGSLVPWLQ